MNQKATKINEASESSGSSEIVDITNVTQMRRRVEQLKKAMRQAGAPVVGYTGSADPEKGWFHVWWASRHQRLRVGYRRPQTMVEGNPAHVEIVKSALADFGFIPVGRIWRHGLAGAYEQSFKANSQNEAQGA